MTAERSRFHLNHQNKNSNDVFHKKEKGTVLMIIKEDRPLFYAPEPEGGILDTPISF